MEDFDNREVRPLMWMVALIIVLPLGFLLIVATADEHDVEETEEPTPVHNTEPVSFADDVMPIFETHCYQCHGPTPNYAARTSLRLTSYDSVMRGGLLPVVEAGDPENSQLFKLLDNGKMPREGERLNDRAIHTVYQWIEQGALNN